MSHSEPATADDLYTGAAAAVTVDDHDPIVDEVRAIREAYAESLGNDPAAIIADLRERQMLHADRVVSLSPNYLAK
jgi:hypothetical protein